MNILHKWWTLLAAPVINRLIYFLAKYYLRFGKFLHDMIHPFILVSVFLLFVTVMVLAAPTTDVNAFSADNLLKRLLRNEAILFCVMYGMWEIDKCIKWANKNSQECVRNYK